MSETVGVERTTIGAALSSSTSTGTSTSANARRLIGAVNVIEAVIAFSWLVWAYGLAEKRDVVGFVELDRTFHLSVLALAGNDTLVGIVGNLRARSRLTGLADLDVGELVASANEHVELLDLLLAGDVAAVTDLMTRHINHVRGIWAGFRSMR